jgi:hypothetical protein
LAIENSAAQLQHDRFRQKRMGRQRKRRENASGSDNRPSSKASDKNSKPTANTPEPTLSSWMGGEKWRVWRENIHFGLQALLVAIGVLALPIYFCQLLEMRDSTDAATKAAKAAENSVILAGAIRGQ